MADAYGSYLSTFQLVEYCMPPTDAITEACTCEAFPLLIAEALADGELLMNPQVMSIDVLPPMIMPVFEALFS